MPKYRRWQDIRAERAEAERVYWDSHPDHIYDINVTRDGRWWMIEIPDINGGSMTQAEQPGDIDRMARDLISLSLDLPVDRVAVRASLDRQAFRDLTAQLRLAEATADAEATHSNELQAELNDIEPALDQLAAYLVGMDDLPEEVARIVADRQENARTKIAIARRQGSDSYGQPGDPDYVTADSPLVKDRRTL